MEREPTNEFVKPNPYQRQPSASKMKSTYVIIGVIAFSQGILGLSDLAINYLYKDDFGMSPAEVSIAQSITSLPWIFKPIWGMVSDSFSLFGYRRKSYLIIFAFIGFLLWQVMAQLVSTQFYGITTLLCINLAVAFCSVIGEALIVEISQKKANLLNLPEEQAQAEASKNVSLFFGIRSVGTLITAFLSGELLELIGKHQIFAITSFFPLTLLLVSFFLEEENKDQKKQRKLKKNAYYTEQTIKQQWEKFSGFIILPQIYKPIMFIFLFMMMPSTGSSMFYFYTNELKFSPEFLGSLRFIYAVGSISAVLIYNKYMKQISFKKQFIITTLICLALGYSQILLVTRDNLKLGIPDKLFTLGDSVIIQIVGEINTMPILVLACRMCPKDIEGTMYALLMSTLNFGGILSGQLGGLLTYFLGITETNFDNLWFLLFLTNTLQLIPIFLLNLIDTSQIKDVSEQNPIIQDHDSSIISQDDQQSLLQSDKQQQKIQQSYFNEQTYIEADTQILLNTDNVHQRNYTKEIDIDKL